MKNFNETDLIAFHLHELSPQKELVVRTAISLDPSLAAESKAIADTLKMFDRQEYPIMIGTEVLDNHWLRLRPSLTPHRPRTLFTAWGLPLTLAAAVTALLVVAFWFSSWIKSSMQQGVTPQTSSSTPSGPPSTPPPATAPAHTSRQRETPAAAKVETRITTQPFPHISIPSIEPSFESAPFAGKIAFSDLPAESPLQLLANTQSIVSPLSSSAGKPPVPEPALTKRRHTGTDFSVGVFGNLIAARTKTDVGQSPYFPYTAFASQSASPSAGIVGSFHQQFGPWLGYRVASSYARNTFAYTNTTYPNTVTTPGTIYTSTSLVNGSTYELTFAYTVQGPSGKRISTDAEVGGGVLLIEPSLSPGTAPSMLERNHRRTALGGIGFNFKLTQRLDLRAEYRTLIYNNPGFGFSPNTRITISSEPTVGVTYHFGKSGDK